MTTEKGGADYNGWLQICWAVKVVKLENMHYAYPDLHNYNFI